MVESLGELGAVEIKLLIRLPHWRRGVKKVGFHW